MVVIELALCKNCIAVAVIMGYINRMCVGKGDTTGNS